MFSNNDKIKEFRNSMGKSVSIAGENTFCYFHGL